ncbi:MAG: type II toxin-antitoxin system RelE/ParE family toxin [Cyanobacteria bacterium SBLK]|nr:type II toxin-antitoxin system RelE/ParE family toxin [Cyanobacteria bacterium SBLK]
MKICIISPAASKDLNEIADYFASRNLDAGDRFVIAFERKCKYLIQFPNMGRSYSDLEESLRGVPVENYIILYRIVEQGVEIVRVVSGYRDLEELFSDSED